MGMGSGAHAGDAEGEIAGGVPQFGGEDEGVIGRVRAAPFQERGEGQRIGEGGEGFAVGRAAEGFEQGGVERLRGPLGGGERLPADGFLAQAAAREVGERDGDFGPGGGAQ